MKSETLIVTSFLVVLTMTMPRKWILLPFVMAACIIPPDQRIIILDLDFTTLRFCIFFAILRLYLYDEVRPIKWNTFDKLFFLWIIVGAVIYVIQWLTIGAVIYKCGVLYDSLGLYWIFRMTILSWNDIHRVVKMFAIFSLISAPLIIYERVTHNNLFAHLGRVKGAFHAGRFRCEGPFPHFIMMGLFWASLIPIFVAYFAAHRSKLLYILAALSALVCVVLSASSTPLMAVVAIAFFGAIWKYRSYGRTIALGFGAMIFALHVVMEAPVWHLVSRVKVFSGSTGWHRFILFDRFVKNIGEWFFLGCHGVEHWGIFKGDITNQYVLEGVRGGALTLIIFIILIVQAVRITGICSLKSRDREARILYWGFCVSILGHCVSFWGVSYFGQIMMLLYLTLAIVSVFEDKVHPKFATQYQTAVKFS
ncbi:MAG: hypothetical protein RQ760_06080 [Sedimentisphaerales bacterium]|nr:hypothetical protein [Sedimentisphaerales bacterium]